MMNCFRCAKPIESANDTNADYVIADDCKVIEDNKEIQKTAIVCPDCYKPTDFIIWGVHKNELEGMAEV